MRSSIVKMIAVSAVSALSIGVADAATISGTYSVIGTDFASAVMPPYASITESFTISFDNAVSVSQQTVGISLNASTIAPSSTLAFTYVTGADTLIVGGLASTVTTSDRNSTDFALVINNASSLSDFGVTSLTYSVGQGTIFTARTVGQPAAVPEPASLTLLATATIALGVMRRRDLSGEKR